MTTGPRIAEVDLHFYGKGEIRPWRRACAKLGIGADGTGDFAESFVLLEQHGRTWEAVFGQVHSVGPKGAARGDAVHWHLDWRRSATEPPKSIVRDSKKLGGYPGFLRKLRDAWPKGSQMECEGEATYYFEAADEVARALPWPEPLKRGPSNTEFSPAGVTWKLTPPAGLLSHVSVNPGNRSLKITASGSWHGNIDSDTIDSLGIQATRDLMELVESCAR